jgi:hypothetical protein
MLVPAPTDLVMIGLAVAGLVGLLAYVIRGGRSLWVILGLGAYTCAAIVAMVFAIAAPYVVRVSGDGAGGVHAERALQVFGHGTSIVINESDKPLTLQAAVFADAPGFGTSEPDDVTIAPHETTQVPAFIDHLGPDDEFPDQVEVDSNASGSSTTQYRLTW